MVVLVVRPASGGPRPGGSRSALRAQQRQGAAARASQTSTSILGKDTAAPGAAGSSSASTPHTAQWCWPTLSRWTWPAPSSKASASMPASSAANHAGDDEAGGAARGAACRGGKRDNTWRNRGRNDGRNGTARRRGHAAAPSIIGELDKIKHLLPAKLWAWRQCGYGLAMLRSQPSRRQWQRSARAQAERATTGARRVTARQNGAAELGAKARCYADRKRRRGGAWDCGIRKLMRAWKSWVTKRSSG